MSRPRIILNIMEKTLQEEKRRTGPNEGLTYKTLKKKISEQGVTESEFASIKKLVNLKLKKNDLELQMGTIKENMDVTSGKLGKVDNEIIQEYKNIDERILTNTRLRNEEFSGVESGGLTDNPFDGAYNASVEDEPDPWLTLGMETKEKGGRKTRRRRKRKRTRRRRTRTRRKRTRRKRTRRKRKRKRTRRKRKGGKKTRRNMVGCRKN